MRATDGAPDIMADRLADWLTGLGYAVEEPEALHRAGTRVPASHPYAPELNTLLRADGAIRAKAVFDVDGVPTVVFLSARGERLNDDELDAVRQRLWNQNLAVVVVAIEGATARALPVRRLRNQDVTLQLKQAVPTGPFSAADIRSGDIQGRLPDWFQARNRVDRTLLVNLAGTVRLLVEDAGLALATAQTLMGQILFISYLEHRGIVSGTYRQAYGVGPLHDLLARGDQAGVIKLITRLRKSFNGDFLAESAHPESIWENLPGRSLDVLNVFLSRVDMDSGQRDFWNYDFSFIPVELLSGLYESFLGSEQKDLGAYYTPRNLATLAVDEVFAASKDPLAETIFDGACGSGILLTTAFRRLLAIKEAREHRQLSLADRIRLLKGHIFGADVNEQATRVTAFSLYLSLLEGLEPADIKALQEQEDVKLPPLRGSNLVAGEEGGEFFSSRHPFLRKNFSVLISNPPWKEPGGGTETSADTWAAEAKVPAVRRQLAGLFALRALDFVAEGTGRVCLILPVSQFLAPTSAKFVVAWLARCRPLGLYNFGDLQQLLFESAIHTCTMVVGQKRAAPRRIPLDETFPYCIPKADVSLAFGRLTLTSADRHRVQTQAVLDDPQRLVTLMWGDQRDLTLWTRLTSRGTLGDFLKAKRWRTGKGVHFDDASVDEPESVEDLRKIPYIRIEPLKLGVPVLHRDHLSRFPEEVETVAAIGERWGLFEGPRILFPDGFSREEREIRATYFNGKASFSSSIGVVAGAKRDDDLLRFTAVYLRSSLASYFLAIRAYQVLCERNRVSLKDTQSFPLFDPADAPDPRAAKDILEEVARRTRELEKVPSLEQPSTYAAMRSELDRMVYRYFGLSPMEMRLVDETVEVLLPSVRPRSYSSLRTPAQGRTRQTHLKSYARTLAEGLADWRHRLKGQGAFNVDVVAMDPSQIGPIGVVRVVFNPKAARDASSVQIDDSAVHATLQEMRRSDLLPAKRGELMQFGADTFVWTDRALYVVRPLIRRCWLDRSALRDAERIVEMVQRGASAQEFT